MCQNWINFHTAKIDTIFCTFLARLIARTFQHSRLVETIQVGEVSLPYVDRCLYPHMIVFQLL